MPAVISQHCGAAHFIIGISWGKNSKTHPYPDGAACRCIYSQLSFVVGMICAAIGYALMSYLMTATPLQVVNVAQLGTSANAAIIQWHVVAMFAPSLTGNLIQRFGIIKFYRLVCSTLWR